MAVADEVARHGLGERSLRDLARATGTSHPRLLYHFGSRDGLVAAVVGYVEDSERAVYRELAACADSPDELIRGLWAHLCAPEMRNWIRLFFESVGRAGTNGPSLTDPWLAETEVALRRMGGYDPDVARIAVATLRGLLIDLVTTDDPGPPTRAVERFLGLLAPHLDSGGSVG